MPEKNKKSSIRKDRPEKKQPLPDDIVFFNEKNEVPPEKSGNENTSARILSLKNELVALTEERDNLKNAIGRYSEFYDFAPSGYLSLDRNGVISDVNLTCAKLLECEKEELDGKNIFDLIPYQSKNIFEDFFRSVFASGRTECCEIEMRKDSSGFFFARLRALAVTGPEKDAFTHCHIILSDITESKVIENKLRESEELFRSLFERIPDAIFLADPDTGMIIDVNTAGTLLVKKSREEIIGFHQSNLYPPEMLRETKEIFVAYIDELRAHGKGERSFYVINSENLIIPVDIRGQIIKLKGKEYVLGIFRDTSGKKRAEAISRIQYELAKLLSSTSDMIFASEKLLEACMNAENVDSGALYLVDESSGAVDILSHRGFSSAYIEKVRHFTSDSPHKKLILDGKPIYSRYPVLVQEYSLDINREKEKLEKLRGVAIIPVLCDEAVVAVLVFASHSHDEISDDARTFLETIAAGIGGVIARIRIETELKQSEERFRTVANFTHDWEYWVSPEGKFLYVSPSSMRITGYAADDFMNNPGLILKIIHPDDLEIFRVANGNMNSSENYEFRIITKSGETRWVSYVGELVYNENNFFLGKRVSNRDITEKKKAEEVLTEARKIAEEAAKAKSEFLANMSHEIRTPLNAIIGFTALLLETQLSDEEKHNCLNMIKNQSDDLLVLINDILDLSKIEAGKLELSATLSKLREIVEKTVNSIAFKAKARGLNISWNVASDVPECILVDAFRLRQVLLNLLGNAIKFTERGSVSLSVKKVEEADVPYSIFSADSPVPWLTSSSMLLQFSVKDTGIGIPAEKQALLFKAFSQIDGSTSRRYGGTGLGLKICYRLVELMSGCIWVESESAKGSVFHFTIRIPLADAAAGNMPLNYAQEKHRPLKILFADDEFVSIILLKKYLEKEGHSVVAVSNGKQLLKTLKNDKFDIILMDLQMPEMDGFEAARRIREDEKNTGRHIPIIAIAPNTMRADRNFCIASGMDDYISKPIIHKDILTIIAKHTY
ncbi:MAG: hypothetical protein A2017_10425 [Lentisphaerae bacterium GWF2_44_16]|nr:MAG: hypothetical protein A2017_10425 [Lentisphaerae bacterium GWF2_44_16]